MKEKSQGHFKKIAAPLVLLVVVTLIARYTGLFYGLDSMITLSFETVIRVIIAVSFVVLLHNVLSMLVSSFRKKPAAWAP